MQPKCQLCESSKMHKFLSLGSHPPSDNFLTEQELKTPQAKYPLDVYFCDNCKLVQLGFGLFIPHGHSIKNLALARS